MDLNVHRAILWLALDRVKQRPNAKSFIVPPAQLARSLFHPLWLGNWATDMGQASAFFDVLENKYRDPYQRWRIDGTYEFPVQIAEHKAEWLAMFNTLWEKECEAVATAPDFAGIDCPQEVRFSDANAIGGYYPCDHFDVADRNAPVCSCKQVMDISEDQSSWTCPGCKSVLGVGHEGACDWKIVPDRFEYDRAKDRLSHTIQQSVFVDCLWGPLNVALKGDRSRFDNLRRLGKALHVLQDFYAHSNFPELLLASTKGLPEPLTKLLETRPAGSFASYIQETDPKKALVVTGRFDQVDTVASILKIYRQSLVPRWKDLEDGGYQGERGKARDLMVEVLFGTFSNEPFFSPAALQAVKTALQVNDFFEAVGDVVKNGAIAFFGGVAKLFADKAAKQSIDRVQDLLMAATDVEARNFEKAGRLLYLERVIERHLEDKLGQDRGANGTRVLPHHTLLAKDQDVGQPECRLVFKLACLMAIDLTAEVLEVYLSGGDLGAMEALLRRRIAHPMTILGDYPKIGKALVKVVPKIYGERWWHVGQAPNAVVLL